MDLLVQDVAEMLNVSEDAIHSWVSEKKIPFYWLNNEYRFSCIEIEDWVVNQNLRSQASQVDGVTGEFSKENVNRFSLYRAIYRGGVYTDIPGNSKEAIIKATMERMAPRLGVDPEVMADLLMDRERLAPTAINHGVAVPHTRDFLLKAHFDVVGVVFPEKPIEYGALDGEPVHALFFMFACQAKRHLHLLAKMAHLSSQVEAQNLLKTRPSRQALLEYVKEMESDLGQLLQPGLVTSS